MCRRVVIVDVEGVCVVSPEVFFAWGGNGKKGLPRMALVARAGERDTTAEFWV